MGQGVQAAGRGAEEGDASGAGEPAGGAATGPAAVRAVRKAGYRPRERKFLVGDLVYLRRQPSDSTDVSVSRGAYKVRQVGVNGRIVLQGADGTLFKEHLETCAPCHNPNIDLSTVDPTLTTVPANHPCQVCRGAGNPERMLLCDYCLEGWHMECLEPVLTSVPAGIWLCPHCVEAERVRPE
jgi:hypothetical protein